MRSLISPEQGAEERAAQCVLYTDESGNQLIYPIIVRYVKWTSQAAMDAYFNQTSGMIGYEETGWHFEDTPDINRGRLIEFQYSDGTRALDWTWDENLLSGEASSDGTQATLKEWWASQ